jgi:hypothetical protein
MKSFPIVIKKSNEKKTYIEKNVLEIHLRRTLNLHGIVTHESPA